MANANRSAAASLSTETDTAAEEQTSTVDYIVAPRRTVHIDGEDFGPGKTVTLDPKEGEYLRGRGFFVEEDGSVTISTSGPAVNQEDGVRKDEA